MGQKTLILGDSGTGKSASLRNFKPEDLLVINCANKPLPFKNRFEAVTPRFDRLTQDVLQAMTSTAKKIIVVDDAQYIMSFQYMRRIKESGWDKWNDIQGDFFNIIKKVDELPADVTVYFLSHLQRDDEGHEKIKTMGKMLDEKITIEGLFTTVLKTAVKDGQYIFLTQNSGMDTVKSPIGMFPTYAIDNDLAYVDEKIRTYYEIGDFKPEEVLQAADQEVARPEVEKPATEGRRSRRKAAVADVDKGTGAITGATHAEQKQIEAENAIADATADGDKLKEIEDLTDQRMKAVEGIERMKHTRRRKERDGKKEEEKPAEAPAEEKKEEASEKPAGSREAFKRARRRNGLEPASEVAPEEIPAEGAKRTRRRRNRPETDADGFMNIPDDADEEVPF